MIIFVFSLLSWALLWLSIFPSCLHGAGPYDAIKEKYIRDAMIANHSGFYFTNNPDTGENYGAAWLTTTDFFASRISYVKGIDNLEGGTNSMVCDIGRQALLTRDFFDFFVVHLSSSANTFRDKGQQWVIRALNADLKRTTEILRNNVDKNNGRPVEFQDIRLIDKTVAIIPFITVSGVPWLAENPDVADIRLEYFKATFWSLRRYVSHIVVAIAFPRDLITLKDMKLPIWKIVDLSYLIDDNNSYDRKHPRSRYMFPKYCLLFLHAKLTGIRDHIQIPPPADDDEDFEWQRFKYVFYTEADQLVYLRGQKQLVDAVEQQNKTLVITPHRMHSYILPQAYPELVRKKAFRLDHRMSLAHIELITEDAFAPQGSCCDNGRFRFKPCNNFWYLCRYWVRTYYV